MKSIPKISLLVLAILSVLIGIIFYVGGTSGSLEAGTDSFDIPAYTDFLLIWSYVLVILSVVLALALVVLNFISKMKNKATSSMKPLIAIGVLGIVLLITFLIGSKEAVQIIGYEGTDNVGFWAQFSDMCLYSIYTLTIGAFLTIIAVNVFKQIKK